MKRLIVLLMVVATACATPTAEQREREARIKAREREQKRGAPYVRITNNAEVVKGCELMGGITKFEKVARFQDHVVRFGGNVGYVVATNEDGEMIGEAYLCQSPQ